MSAVLGPVAAQAPMPTPPEAVVAWRRYREELDHHLDAIEEAFLTGFAHGLLAGRQERTKEAATTNKETRIPR